MKKLQVKACRMLLAFAAMVLMFSIQKTDSRAANDTIVIDFSKVNPQTYNGKKLTSPDLDRINDFNLNEEQKNVVFLSSMIEIYKIFDVDSVSYSGSNVSGRVILNSAANQYLTYQSTPNSQQFNAGSSKGTYEVIINDEYLKRRGNRECLMPYFAGKVMYGVDAKDANGKWYYKLKIVFNDPNSATVKDDENRNTPAKESKENKDNKNSKDSKENKNNKNNKENNDDESTKVDISTVENFNPDTDFEENGNFYRVTGSGEVSFIGISNKKRKTVNIPDTVLHQAITYNVTSVADKALFGNKKVKKVTIGKNVKAIGQKAFAKCKSLKKVTIKSTQITKIGKKIFKKNSDKLVVKVPKSKYNSYKKLFKKAGIPSVKLSKMK